jgi:signal transduction histidine kinase
MAAIVKNEIDERYLERENLLAEVQQKYLLQQVAHDLRSPLSVFGLLLPSYLESPDIEKADLLKNSSNRAIEIANSLMTRTKIDVSANTTDVVAAVKRVLTEKKIEFAKSNINIDLEFISIENSCFIGISESIFNAIISNLLNNSADAVQGIVQPRISLSVVKSKNWLTVTIEDNGIGIPDEIKESVGQRGFTTKKLSNASGWGLGLYNAKRTIDEFGGRFAIDSNFKTGTKVILSIPILV